MTSMLAQNDTHLQQANTGNPCIDRFLGHCHLRRYPAKNLIIYAGDTPDTLYYIMEGSVTVLMDENDGREIVLAYLNKGDFFGEMGLFEGQRDRSAWVRARSDCLLAEIGYAKFKQLCQQTPELLFELSGQMAARLRRTSQKVGDLAFLDVTGRIARTLLELCQQPDAMTHPDGMQIKITRQELGRIVGCSREMAGRVLKDMEERGLLTASGKTIVVFGTR